MKTFLLIKEALLLCTICLLMIACKNKVSEKSTMAETGFEQQDVYLSMKKTIYTNDTAKFDSLLQCILSLTPCYRRKRSRVGQLP